MENMTDLMNQNLSSGDIEKVRHLTEVRENNNEFSWLLCDYINNNPRIITKELIESINDYGSLTDENAFCALMAGFCGLDIETKRSDRFMAEEYFRPAIKKLDAEKYRANPYYKNILIPEEKFRSWEFRYERYEPFEAFIFNEPVLGSDFKEVPQVGFFNEPFLFPTVAENGHEWMSIKPDEIETMQSVIDIIEGEVVTFGLGLGYFTYMASLKENVSKIVVVEHNSEVIRLFEKFILPQFTHKEKVEIAESDAFEFIKNQLPQKKFDCAFFDLWHDVSDGLDTYLRIKKMEHLNNNTRFYYWIENTLLSGLRWQVFEWIINNTGSYDEIKRRLGDEFLRKLAATSPERI
jgi:hypothetical protein